MTCHGTVGVHSKLAGRLWLAAALALTLLIWQQAVGWPIKRHVLLKNSGPADADLPGVSIYRFRAERDGAPWVNAFMRITEQGTLLYRCTSLDQLRTLTAPGFCVRGKKVYVRPFADGQSLTAELPWAMPPSILYLLITAFAGATAFLFARGNETIVAAVSAAWRPRDKFGQGLWFAGAVAVMILAGAVLYRAHIPSFPIIGEDTPEYLKPASRLAYGGSLYATADRPFGCPLAFGTALTFLHDLKAIIILQEFATLFAAGSLGVVLFLAGRRLFKEPALQILAAALGLSALAALAFNENILEREWAILPEGWAAFYLGVSVLLTYAISSAKLGRWWSVGCYIALCVTTWMLCLTKPNWGLAVALTPLPLIVRSAAQSGSWRKSLGWGLAGIGIFAIVSVMALGCQLWLTPVGRSAGLEVRSKALLCWHAPMVRREIEHRLQAGTDSVHQAALLDIERVIDEAFARAKEIGPGAYEKLGYDADWILYVGLKKADALGALQRDDRIGLCRGLFFSALRNEPTTYLRKVVSQFSSYFSRPYGAYTNFQTGPAFIRREMLLDALKRSEQFVTPAPAWLPEEIRAHLSASLASARPQLEGQWPSAFRYGFSLRISVLFEYLRRAFLPALIVPLMLLAMAAAIPRWRQAVDWRRLAPVLCLAIWTLGAANLSALTSSIAQALEIQRYIDLYMPLTLLSELLWPMLGIALLIEGARAIRSRSVSKSSV